MVTNQSVISPPPPARAADFTNPVIAVDPTNPLNLVSAYQLDDQGNPGRQKVFILGQFSTDGGNTWSSLAIPPQLTDPSTDPTNRMVFQEDTDPSVAFDRNHNFYLVYSEHSLGTHEFGTIILNKYSFGSPVATIQNKQLYNWGYKNSGTDGALGFDAALSPVVAVDNNLPVYTDPITGGVQRDLFAGNVYVSFTTNYKIPTGFMPANQFNPNTIRIVASSDGGANFSSVKTLNAANFGPTFERDGEPSLAISQGTANNRPTQFGQVAGGNVTAVWNNFGSPNGDPRNPAMTNGRFIESASVQDGATSTVVNGSLSGMCSVGGGTPRPVSGGAYCEAQDPGMSMPHLTGVSTFDTATPVALDPAQGNVTGLNVTIDILDFNIQDVQVVLISPTGARYILVNNHINAAGNVRGNSTNNRIGLDKHHLGVWTDDMERTPIDWDTVFDPLAPRVVNDAGVDEPYSGHFRPEGTLPTNLSVAQANGTWTLEISDFRDHSMDMPQHPQVLRQWHLSFTQHLTTPLESPRLEALVTGVAADGARYFTQEPRKPPVYPGVGYGPGVSIASDNTLGSFSPYQGRLYVVFTGVKVNRTTSKAEIGANFDQTSIYEAVSDNGGLTWTEVSDRTSPPVPFNTPTPIDDDAPVDIETPPDGFSEGNRPHFQPSVAVDQYTGTVAVTYRDGRYDAARRRVVTTLATSIDGGRTFQNAPKSFGQQVYLNIPQTAGDAITGRNVNVQPIPDNESGGNADANPRFGFGAHMGLAIANGHVYPLWAGNENGDPTLLGTNMTNRNRLRIFSATVSVTAGPRVVGSTTGPVTKGSETLLDDGVTILPYNASFTADGVQQVDGFVVTFDRPIADGRGAHGQASLTPDDIFVYFHDTVTPQSQLGTRIPVLSVTPIFDYEPSQLTIAGGATGLPFTPRATQLAFQQYFGANRFLVRIAPQRQTGTYSYALGPMSAALPGPKDLIRSPSDPTVLGNQMDQNANGVAGEQAGGPTGGDTYAAPSPANNGANFFAPYDRNTLPIVLPGPHIVNAFVTGNPLTPDNLVLNGVVSGVDIVFDRDMDPTTLTPASILRMIGPAGAITGPFTITPDPFPNYQRSINGNVTTGADPDPSHPRTYRISFPGQQVSGTYTVNVAPTVRAVNGDQLDTNLNAGVDILRDNPVGGATTPVTSPTGPGVRIQPNATVESDIVVNDNFLIQGLTLTLNISYFFDPDLSAFLQAPDGTRIQLFTNIGLNGQTFRDFTNTVFDDNASVPSGDPNPVQQASAPFSGRFNPQQPLSVLVGKPVNGTYRLFITSRSGSTTPADRLNSWTLTFTKALPKTGLGEPVADQATVNFRIFNFAKNNAVASKEWTAVGPAGIGDVDPTTGQLIQPNSHSSRIAGIAVDPSDPSGNTAFVAGASGGVWKTTNFLTTDPRGPTYVPLTDTAPTLGLNIGSIAVFGRNNDTNQSIVFVATGEGDTQSPGVGLLRSLDGGQHWTLLDSTDNTLPFASRDHKFDGNTAFKVVVDPTATRSGGVIVYVAFSGRNGGIYRSNDSGNTWALERAGQATDVALAAGSADANSGNLRIVYGAFRGEGVFMNDSLGARWNLMAGGRGVLYADPTFTPPVFVTVSNGGVTPNGAQGRISLAVPALVPSTVPNSRVLNLLYQGWVYAIVSTPAGLTEGLYLTKDFGQNWTKLKIPTTPPPPGRTGPVNPTNDDTDPNLSILGSMNFPQGNYNQSVVVDPNNPSVVYLGGTADGNPTALIRIDTTGIADARALLPYNNFRNDGRGNLETATTGPVQLAGGLNGPAGLLNPFSLPAFSLYNQPHWLNLLNDPFQPFVGNSTLEVANLDNNGRITTETNDGAQVRWIFYDTAIDGNTDLHRMVAVPDPLTGKTRLIFGLDQGIFSVVDPGDGTANFATGIGTAQFASDPSRNGNLQLSQFYGGASQPSQLAANIAGALLYGEAQDDGFPLSDPNLLNNGNLEWTGSTGDGQWVGTDPTGQGGVYEYRWPCCQGGETTPSVLTDFFRFNRSTSRTFGLFLNPPPDTQNWPMLGGFNAAVNPVNGQQLLLSSALGNVFRTDSGGFRWNLIGAGSDLDNTNAQALAYGAPDPQDPTGLFDNFIWAGTSGVTSTGTFVNGHVFVTLDGGGAWTNLSAGLDNSPVQFIVTNPNRGSHEAYAVTTTGVFHITFDVTLNRATNKLNIVGNPAWEKITGNLFQVAHISFGDPTLLENQLQNLTSLAADWRYAILDDPSNPNSPTHPVLYVGGDSGVYRSQDKGKTWALFPNVADDSAPVDGGYLPNAKITHLDLVLGNVNPQTGSPIPTTSPDMLLATTYGRGQFAIRLAPPKPVQEVFVIGTNNLVYGQRLDARGNPAGGYFNTSPGQVKAIAPGHDGLSRPLLFVIGLDNQVYAQRFDANGNPNGTFYATAPGQVKAAFASNDASGNPELFVIGLNDNVYALHLDAGGNPVGSYFAVDQGAVKSLVVSHDAQNRPEVFVQGLDNQIYARRLDAAGNPVAGETYFLTQGGQVKSFDVGQDSNGQPIVFAIGQDNQVYGERLDANGLNAAPWYLVVPGQVKSLTAGHDANNNPIVFVTGLNDAVFYAALDGNGVTVNGTYLATAPGSVAGYRVSYDANNIPEVFAVGLDGQIYLQQFNAPGRPVGSYRLMDAGQVLDVRPTPDAKIVSPS